MIIAGHSALLRVEARYPWARSRRSGSVRNACRSFVEKTRCRDMRAKDCDMECTITSYTNVVVTPFQRVYIFYDLLGLRPRKRNKGSGSAHKALHRSALWEKHPVLRVGGAERAYQLCISWELMQNVCNLPLILLRFSGVSGKRVTRHFDLRPAMSMAGSTASPMAW
jgi:hypothetical protein